MKGLKHIIVSALLCTVSANALAYEVLGYTYRGDSISHLLNDDIVQQNASLKRYAKQIQIVAPQAYQVNEKGMVWGAVDPVVKKIALKHGIQVMPLVTNVDFDTKRTHQFLTDSQAMDVAIKQLVELCKAEHYPGLQIDFEHISMDDKQNFTRFFEKIAQAMHQQHLVISAAIFPHASDAVPATARGRSSMAHWSGGYDYEALGKAADFITLMAYDEHGSGTMPGSACEPAWVEPIIQYAVAHIPPEKVSLGLPTKSAYWYTRSGHNDAQVVETDLTYSQLQYLLEKFNLTLQWDPVKKLSFVVFLNNNLNETLFAEDAKTFQVKLDLVKKYHLRGVALWRLGVEDPGIWDAIKKSF